LGVQKVRGKERGILPMTEQGKWGGGEGTKREGKSQNTHWGELLKKHMGLKTRTEFTEAGRRKEGLGRK